jgi:DNA polymerase-3 subunit gamma/tau
MTTELYKVYRPKTFKAVAGQDATIKQLTKMLKGKRLPHSLLFHGPSGCGKTTLARIVADKLGCKDHDLAEMNCADIRGIDAVRQIRSQVNLAPVVGKCRVWIIDEAHKLTNDAQNAFLKLLEDTPRTAYFFLATTEPGKLITTVRTRCTELPIELMSTAALKTMIARVCGREEIELPEDVGDALLEASGGSARKALVLLDQVRGENDEDEQLRILSSADERQNAIEIARMLIRSDTTWKGMAKLLKSIDDEPEGLRHMILGYATSVVLGCGPGTPRAATILEEFSQNFYDSKRAGLVNACYAVIAGE